MKQSILLNTDSYKASMFVQYPPKTEAVYSYIESRDGKYNELVFFGLQAFIKEYLSDPITQEDIDEAEAIWTAHGEPFNRSGWEYILNEHDGYLPVEIKAVPEGMPVAIHDVMLTIENTDPNCFWLTTYLETALLRAIWYPTTVATNSRKIKKLIASYMDKTSDSREGLVFKLHDFGARGVSSNESAMLGGMSHLINFMGTDTIVATLGARKYYGADMAGFSIPAAEHSTITSWGKENEVEAYRNMVKQFGKPGALVAVVSDSYDIYNAVENLWGEKLRQEVIDSGATVVVRPDSGIPWKVVRDTVKLLDKKYGSTKNSKGYRVLNNVRVIQGDGVDYEAIDKILQTLFVNRYSADNVAFGMGANLLSTSQRDDQKFAMKCSAAKVDGVWRDVFKDPITDPGKKSKKGRFDDPRLKRVFYNGKLVRETTFDEVRQNAML